MGYRVTDIELVSINFLWINIRIAQCNRVVLVKLILKGRRPERGTINRFDRCTGIRLSYQTETRIGSATKTGIVVLTHADV